MSMASRATRLVLVAPNGALIERTSESHPAHLLALDLSAVPNADARTPVTVAVEQYCNLGHWHRVGHPIELPCYDLGQP